MEKVESRINPKVLFCTAGVRQFAVPEQFIIFRNGFEIKAIQAFAIDFLPSAVASPGRTPVININLASMRNVVMNCSLICDLSEEDPVYKGVLDAMSKLNN